MDPKDLSMIEAIVNPLSIIAKGAKALAQWQSSRIEKRYQEFVAAAKDGNVFRENAEAMTPDDLFAILRFLELDMESEKAGIYGRLAASIGTGNVFNEEKRHFIKSLHEMSHAQVQLLRKAWVAGKFELFPGRGSGRRSPTEFLKSGSPVDMLLFQTTGISENGKLTELGSRFVEACFSKPELDPVAIGEKAWAPGSIQIVCNEMNSDPCNSFIIDLSEMANRNAIKIAHHTAMKGVPTPLSLVRGTLVVLLTHDPDELVKHWSSVQSLIQKKATVVVVTVRDPPIQLPNLLAQHRHFDASGDLRERAVNWILALFEQS